MRVLWHIICLIVLLCRRNVSTASSSKSFAVTTLVNTKWSQTPLYIEIAEYIADEGDFWDYLKGLDETETYLSEYDTESQQYVAAIGIARSHLSALQLPLLKLAVAMHSLTPRIQAHLQAASECLKDHQACEKTFVHLESATVCKLDDLMAKIEESFEKNNAAAEADEEESIDLYSFDHIYPGTANYSRTVVLYGDIGTREFFKFHRYLSKQCVQKRFRYVVRNYLQSISPHRVRLSGYGVELHLKSTEYKSQDDALKSADKDSSSSSSSSSSDDEDNIDDTEVQGLNFKVLQARFPKFSHSLNQLKRSLIQSNDQMPKLKAWEFQDLGIKAAAAIAEVQGEEALNILQYTAQNFPMQSRTFVGKTVSDALRKEVEHNIDIFGKTLSIMPPEGALYVNGILFDAERMDLGTLLETIRDDLRVLENLHSSGISGNIASSLLNVDFSTTAKSDLAIDIRDTAIVWINDIESDAQYRRWPSSVTDLLRPIFPGMLRNIRKNLFNLALVIDPLDKQSRDLVKLAESFVFHMAPIRLGLVIDATAASAQSNIEEYHAILCAFNFVSQRSGAQSALTFLTDVFADMPDDAESALKYVRQQLKNKFPSLSKSDVEAIIAVDSEYDYGLQLATEFVERLGFPGSPQALMNGVPIQQSLLTSANDFEEAIFSEIIQQTSTLQKAVYKGELSDNDVIIDFLMNQPHVMPRLNQRILDEEDVKFLDLSGIPYTNLNNVQEMAQLTPRDMTATLMKNVKYFQLKKSSSSPSSSDLASLHFLTIWIFADLSTDEGRALLKNALLYQKDNSGVRVAFVPNTESDGAKNNLNRLIWALSQVSRTDEQNTVDIAIDWLNQTDAMIVDIPDLVKDIIPSTELHMKILRVYSQRVLNLKKSERLVIGNGKIYGPLRTNEQFTVDDFGLLDYVTTLQYGEKIRKVLKQHTMKNDDGDDEQHSSLELSSDALLKLYVSLMPRQTKTRYKMPGGIKDTHSVLKFEARDNELPHFEISAIIDPASRSAQKLAPILILFRTVLNCQMRVYLTPTAHHSDMPVKNFYRFVIEPEVQFDSSGKLSERKQIAKFTGLPLNSLLTQNLHVPDNWLVEAVRSVYDLDNIKLDEIGGPVHSEFELEFLLIEGHCFDVTNGAPPRGLQITLKNMLNDDSYVDTIVMANLGYFQLKANPGAWELRLREGKSADLYDITNAEGPNTFYANHTVKIIISSLRPHVTKLRVTKKPEMRGEDLLSETESPSPSSGIWNSIANSFSNSYADARMNDETDQINIFSVASGHLYERLLRIMMLSLLKHTKSPVKFWFLKNYLSPQFTDFLPHMAREYGFQYELVQYKWPRWLHPQTEKQRIIWGYKILFLDVLFPLSVRKIIFVDADAIVRTDIKELYDMDLGNSPYAYTPFCDSRKEMDGFRFWKQGYWRSHLMGRRYHISALYVVDLKRFRKVAAGDRLRGQYQALSQDPNSLANLDQDLPNNMIHQVSIKSLPDEWLWCETWCSDSSLKNAKVIDLCNNPQTKEAKLTAAQRIVPEWKDYDEEIKRLMAQIIENENVDNVFADNSSEDAPEQKPIRENNEHIEL